MLGEMLSPAVWFPKSLEEAWGMRQRLGSHACFIAAGTLLQIEWEKGRVDPGHLINLEGIDEIKGVSREVMSGRSVVRIGALTTLGSLLSSSLVLQHSPLVTEAVRGIAAPAVRNRATIGGNVASGIGDAIPALLAADALVSTFDGSTRLTKPLWRWLQEKDNGQITSSEIVAQIELPGSGTADYFYRKIGRREAFIPSVVTIAGCCMRKEDGTITHIRLAAGGGETSPQRLQFSEKLLQGMSIQDAVLEDVYRNVLEEFQPVSDVFASAYYRKQIAANVIASELAKFA
ncbi:FAD binding domain-containing protein [Ectobacillus funiculus]|uniref:FAD binding domain-containing protein n=1 Tax=Ectobacillus funiculus TaxID=137993 RepID=A0ABV5WHQ5_9BACI